MIFKRFIFWLKKLRYIIHIIYFNFHYLPIKQASKLPIFLYNPHLLCCKGRILLKPENGIIKTGMIRLGYRNVSIYPNNGIIWENKGGVVVFKGECNIGNASAIAIGKNGILILGKGVSSTAALKIACQHSITIGNQTLFGWEVTIMDSDFHKVTYTNGETSPRGYAPIIIGNECWIGYKSQIMKGTVLAERIIVSSNSLCNKKYTKPCILLAGQPATIKRTGIYRDFQNDVIDYPIIDGY